MIKIAAFLLSHMFLGEPSKTARVSKMTIMLPQCTDRLKHGNSFIYTNLSLDTLQAAGRAVTSILEDSTSKNLLINTVAVYGCK